MLLSIILSVFGAFSVGVLLWKYGRHVPREMRFPPGPAPLPLLGNLHQMPLSNLSLQFQRWAQQYGPIVGLKLGFQHFILLNEPKVIRELIEKRGNIHSGRPDLFLREFGGNRNFILRDNDHTWRRQRKMYHKRLNVNIVDQYLPFQLMESTHLLKDMLDLPVHFPRHIQRYSTSLSSIMFYGWRTNSVDEGYARELVKWLEATAANAAPHPVDFFPLLRLVLRFLPSCLSTYKRNMRDIKATEEALFEDLMLNAERKIEQGNQVPSFVRDMLLCPDDDRLDRTEIAYNAAHGFAAAMDTQWNTLLGFVKAMILFPHVQEEAQREIELVVGSKRLPTWKDRPSLPYVHGVVEETLRWMPTLIVAFPHRAMQSDQYEGFHIPKGSSMVINVTALNNLVERPREFDPTRYTPEYLASDLNAVNPDSTKRMHFTYGAGRRVCPGSHAAARGLFLAISRMLWAFRFSRGRDQDGNMVPIDPDAITEGFLAKPVSYPCLIQPRDEHRARLIRDAWANVQSSLGAEGDILNVEGFE
ncbi:putative cytochrome P450 [Aspergillus californicus]